ncbi:MAG: hypothetical protein M3014_06115 [Chloroflexota bacterium]|nr:hypothetical protein [Chloroflexota bacterium]
MATIYHPKKTTTKLLEGAIGGLIGGVVVALIMLVADLLLRDGKWYFTPSLIGSLVKGTAAENTYQFLPKRYLIGAIIHFVIFAIVGVGLVQYLPIFRRFKIQPMLAGALYGAIIWLFIFFIFLNSFKPDINHYMDQYALFIANVVGGAAIGWWIHRQNA